MQYQTTRSSKKLYSFEEMIRTNIPVSDGYFVPEKMPVLSDTFINELRPLNFLERAKKIFSVFAPDLDESLISDIIESAWRDDFELEKLPESKLLNPYLENPAFIFMCNGKTGSYLDFVHSFLLSIIKYLSKKDEKWLLITNEKNTDIKAMLGLDFDPEQFTPVIIVNSRNTKNFTLREMQYIWNEKHFSYNDQEVNKEQEEILSSDENPDTTNLEDLSNNKILDFSDDFVEANKLDVFRVKADIREFERITETLFQNQELRAKLQDKNIHLFHMGSLNFAYYIALVMLLISAYLDLIEAEVLENDENFIFAFPNNNLDFLYAGILLIELGLPISKFSLTTNRNKSIVEFLDKGTLKENRKFFNTNTEGLDQIYFPNLEYFIFEIVNRDVDKTKQALEDLSSNQNETLINILEDFRNVIQTDSISNKKIKKQISDWYLRTDYLFDPYTALVFEHLTKTGKIESSQEKIIIPVIEHPLLSSQLMAEAIFSKKQTKRKHFNQIMAMVSEESGLTAPVSALSTTASPEVIYLEIKDLISKLEEVFLNEEVE